MSHLIQIPRRRRAPRRRLPGPGGAAARPPPRRQADHRPELGLSRTSVFEVPSPPAYQAEDAAPGEKPLPPRLSRRGAAGDPARGGRLPPHHADAEPVRRLPRHRADRRRRGSRRRCRPATTSTCATPRRRRATRWPGRAGSASPATWRAPTRRPPCGAPSGPRRSPRSAGRLQQPGLLQVLLDAHLHVAARRDEGLAGEQLEDLDVLPAPA